MKFAFSPLPLYLAVSLLLTSVVSVEIVLEPVEGSGTAFEDGVADEECEDWCTYDMFVTSPTSTDISCIQDDWDETVCSGSFDLDTSSDENLSISFQAPAGKELEISTSGERIEFEFQAERECSSAGNSQSFEGFNITVALLGSNTSQLVIINDDSFLELGNCEIFSRIQFAGEVSQARISSVTWSVTHDPTKDVQGVQTFTFSPTSGYSWIRAETVTQVDYVETATPTAADADSDTDTDTDNDTDTDADTDNDMDTDTDADTDNDMDTSNSNDTVDANTETGNQVDDNGDPNGVDDADSGAASAAYLYGMDSLCSVKVVLYGVVGIVGAIASI